MRNNQNRNLRLWFVFLSWMLFTATHAVPLPALVSDEPVFYSAESFSIRILNMSQAFDLSSETFASLQSVTYQLFMSSSLASVMQCFNNASAVPRFVSVSRSFVFNSSTTDLLVRFDGIQPTGSEGYLGYMSRLWLSFTSGREHGPTTCMPVFRFPAELYSLEIHGLSATTPNVVLCSDEEISAGFCFLKSAAVYVNGTVARLFADGEVEYETLNASRGLLSVPIATVPARADISSDGMTANMSLWIPMFSHESMFLQACHTASRILGTNSSCSSVFPVIVPRLLNVTGTNVSELISSSNATMFFFHGNVNDSVLLPPSFATDPNNGLSRASSLRVFARLSETNSTTSVLIPSEPSLKVVGTRSIYLRFGFEDPAISVLQRLSASYRVSFSLVSLVASGLGADYAIQTGSSCSIAPLPAYHEIRWFFTNDSSAIGMELTNQTTVRVVDGCMDSVYITFSDPGTLTLALVSVPSPPVKQVPDGVSSPSRGPLDLAVIIAVAVGGTIVVAVLATTLFWVIRKRKRVHEPSEIAADADAERVADADADADADAEIDAAASDPQQSRSANTPNPLSIFYAAHAHLLKHQ
eukprot:ANDGO_05173.mRNA.1 hypothetical protein